jgi:hypothetical protein
MSRRALPLLLGAPLVAGALLAPKAARAEDSIDEYLLELTPDAKNVGEFHLALAYRTEQQTARRFKFVGRSPVEGFHAIDDDGQRLDAMASREASSGEWKLEWAQPSRVDGQGRRWAHVHFRQALDHGWSWRGDVAAVDWAHVFKIPVRARSAAVLLPAGTSLDAEGWTCAPAEGKTRCVRAGYPTPLRVPLGHSTSLGAWAFMVVALGAAAFGLAHRARGVEGVRLAEKGVLPPESDVAYPEATDYRAPPPIPVQAPRDPVLPADERAKIDATRRAVALFVVGTTAAVGYGASGNSRIEMPVLIALWVALASIIGAIWLDDEKTGGWLGFAGVVGAVSTLAFGTLLAFVIALAIAGVVRVLGLLGSLPSGGGGGGGSSWGSSSSSSSCSSSSCGGGGGGGGCGGGGGGGGCGG